MNITRENFEESFGTVSEAIHGAHFIAMDCEFTGLSLPGSPRQGLLDSVETRYKMGRTSTSSFMLSQYGLCCFRYDDKGSLEARPFNFFVFPSTSFRNDRVFSCQASSLDFLIKHGFDFQTWVAQGVPFLSRGQETRIREHMTLRKAQEEEEIKKSAALAASNGGSAPSNKAADGTMLESLDQADKDMVMRVREKVEALVRDATASGAYEEHCVDLDPMNGRQRWLIYEFVGGSNSQVKLSNLTGPSYARGIQVRTLPPDPKQREAEEARARAEAHAKVEKEIQNAIGFRRVIDELHKAGKPVITHNGLLDLLHTYDKFVGPLPESLEEGAQALHSLFPIMFDSKAMMVEARQGGLDFPRTVLGDAFRWLCQSQITRDMVELPSDEHPKEPTPNGVENMEDAAVKAIAWQAVFAEGFGDRYASGEREHEAGYDAYLTGCCFAATAILGLGVRVQELKDLATGGDSVVPLSLRPLLNTIPLHKVLADRRLHLPGPGPPLDFSRMLHVSGFPREATTSSVLSPLSRVCGNGSVKLHWIDITSAVAECFTPEAALELLHAASSAETEEAQAQGEAEAPRLVDPGKLLLQDLRVRAFDSTGRPRESPPTEPEVKDEPRSNKRPREENEEQGP